MDRRTLLAFGLIGIIIFAMPYYFRWLNGEPLYLDETSDWNAPGATHPIEPANQDPRRDILASPPTDPPLRAETQPATTPDDSSRTITYEPREIVVETDRYTATFSTRGAQVVSFRLKDHVDGDGFPLELIEPGAAGLGLAVAGRSLTEIEFSLAHTASISSARNRAS